MALSQSHYEENIPRKFGHFDVKLVSTTYDPNKKLVKNNGRCISKIEYAIIIGSLIFVMHCTRLDIEFSIDM